MTQKASERLSNELETYFRVHGRDLPWRRTKDPYRVLVSELMLQQTQVSRVIPKWHAWLEKFPTLRALAESQKSDVLKMWSGLGYNSRALRLRELAIVVMKEWRGKLPHEPEKLLTLPGIGPYTANAIASFAFDADALAMDVNLKRVLGRYFGKQGVEIAVPKGKGRMMNSALMDIGSSVCGRTPQCEACPLFKSCKTKGRATFEVVKKSPQKFEESDRCIRGTVLRELLKGARFPAQLKNVAGKRCVNVTNERLRKILVRLEKEGLLVMKESRVTLPR